MLILKSQEILLDVNGTRNWVLSILFNVENIIIRRIIVQYIKTKTLFFTLRSQEIFSTSDRLRNSHIITLSKNWVFLKKWN